MCFQNRQSKYSIYNINIDNTTVGRLTYNPDKKITKIINITANAVIKSTVKESIILFCYPFLFKNATL